MLDQLSEGRFEFGTGRGSSTTEQARLWHRGPELTREMVAETLPRSCACGRYRVLVRRQILLDAGTQRAAQALHPAPPAAVDGGGQPSTFELAAKLGVGVLCFAFTPPQVLTPLIAKYKEMIQDCTDPVGAYINNNVMITTQMLCMEDGAKARQAFLKADSSYHLSLVFRYLDTFPKPRGYPSGRGHPRGLC